MDHVNKRAQPRVANFIKAHFRKGKNYDCEAIAQLLDRFDVEWGKKNRIFKSSRDDIVQSISSLYTLRNSVAHGGSGNPGIRGVVALHQAAQELVDELLSVTS
jgi:N-acetylglutamate synthase-like GNAT family acetyltransferase